MSIQNHDTKYEVGEHYEIGELCGGGAYGKVFKAKCKKTGKECAIKLVPNKEERQKYNEREVQALIRLNLSDESTRNIIQYFESRFVRVNGVRTLCIQMELCWKDLKTFVYENRQFAPQFFSRRRFATILSAYFKTSFNWPRCYPFNRLGTSRYSPPVIFS